MSVIQLKEKDGTCVIGPSGTVNVDEAEAIILAIRNLALSGRKSFVVDLKKVTYPDYKGLSLLVKRLKELSNGERLFSFSGVNEYSSNLLSLIDPGISETLIQQEGMSKSREPAGEVRRQAV